jgi:hypothetical protein
VGTLFPEKAPWISEADHLSLSSTGDMNIRNYSYTSPQTVRKCYVIRC